MAEPDVVIAGVGMMTAVGLSAAETVASVRAGMARFTESSFYDRSGRPLVLAQVPDDGLPDLEEGLAGDGPLGSRQSRLLRLGTMPLRECAGERAASQQSLSVKLALPELESSQPLEEAGFLSRFAKQTGVALDGPLSGVAGRGRAGGLVAIGRAVSMIRADKADVMVAGGIDTYLDLYVLGVLDREQRVSSAAHLDGFVPGEGAAWLLLCSRETAEAAGRKPLAVVTDVFEGVEEGHFYSKETYRGEGLAEAIGKLFEEDRPEEPVRDVYSSMNGESHWSKEWGVAFTRNREAFDASHRIHHPADCFGDTGAACGPLMVGLAALGIAGGYCGSPCLVYGSSDRGGRAALTVRAV